MFRKYCIILKILTFMPLPRLTAMGCHWLSQCGPSQWQRSAVHKAKIGRRCIWGKTQFFWNIMQLNKGLKIACGNYRLIRSNNCVSLEPYLWVTWHPSRGSWPPWSRCCSCRRSCWRAACSSWRSDICCQQWRQIFFLWAKLPLRLFSRSAEGSIRILKR